MPIIKSAKKRMKQAEVRRKYNVGIKTAIKKQTRVVKDEVVTGTVKSSEQLKKAISQIDKAVKKGVLHKRTAARRKSQLSNSYNSVAKQAYGTEKAGAKAKKPAKSATKKPASKK